MLADASPYIMMESIYDIQSNRACVCVNALFLSPPRIGDVKMVKMTDAQMKDAQINNLEF